MKVLISGAKGFIGSALSRALQNEGHQLTSLTRKKSTEDFSDIYWNPEQGLLDQSRLEGFEAVIHLAGESIAEGRWTEEKKKRIRDSRVQGTTFLSESLARLQSPPQVFVTASAIGFYGDRGNEVLDESSSGGQGFLPEVCQAWENSTAAAKAKGIRTVHVRTGIVLGKEGGALKAMLIPFKLGVGGRLGDGQQYMSWIVREDLVRIFQFVLVKDAISGPVNGVGPLPVTNLEFTKALGAVLHRPTLFPAPAFALKIALGEMAEALLLSSARVQPKKLLDAGFGFKYGEVNEGLRSIFQ